MDQPPCRSTVPTASTDSAHPRDAVGVESLISWGRFVNSWPEPLRQQLVGNEMIAKQCYCWGYRDRAATTPAPAVHYTEGEISVCLGTEALAALKSRRATIDAELAARRGARTEAGPDGIMSQHLREGGSPCS
jgi:hypothetical protein